MEKKAEIMRIITFLVIASGFGLVITSVSEISHAHFIAGLLLFTLGTSWYSYQKGYGVGKYNALAEQKMTKDTQ